MYSILSEARFYECAEDGNPKDLKRLFNYCI
jgi:hypothetical protein